MSASSFRINQPPATGYTYWDRARRDLVLGDVECEAQNKSESSYLWEIVSAPPGETITITNPTSHTCQFTLATRYGYLVRLTVNAGEIDESQTTLYMGIALANSGTYLPALNETNQDNSQSPYDGSRGTEEKINDALIKFDGGYSWIYDEVDDYLYPQSTTARIKGASGTLANPTLGFKDDIDTGVYLPSTGIMSFVSGGAEVLRMHVDTGDPYIDVAGADDFYIRNEGNPVGVGVTTHIESRTTNADPTGTSIVILSEAYEATSAVASVQAKSPGGASSAYLTASTVGVAGGASNMLARAIGAGATTATVSSATTGAYTAAATLSSSSPSAASETYVTAEGSTATVNIQATSLSNAAIINIEPSGNDATSYLNLGGAHTRMTFTDYLRTGSTYTAVMPLSGSQTHWNNFVTDFGVTSLLDGIYKAAHQSLQVAYDAGTSITTVTGTPVSMTGSAGGSEILSITSSNTGYPILVLDSGDTTNIPFVEMLRVGTTTFGINMYYDDGVHIYSGGAGASNGNNHIIFTTKGNSTKDHDLGTSNTEVRLYIFSSTDPDTDNSQWMGMWVDATGIARLTTGSSYLTTAPSTASSHGLDSPGDLYVGGELDVESNIYASNIQLQANAEQTVFSAIYYANTHFSMFLDSEGIMFSAPWSNKIIFTDVDNIGKEHDHNIIYSDPTLVLYSGYDVDLDDDLYATMSVGSSGVLTIYSQSGYTRIGTDTDTPISATGVGDLYIYGEVESSRMIVNTTGNVSGFNLYRSDALYLQIAPFADDGVHVAISGVSGRENNHIILTTAGNVSKDHDQAALDSNPMLFLYSATDVDTDNTQWMAFRRDASVSGIYFGDYGNDASYLYIQNTVSTLGALVSSAIQPAVIVGGVLTVNLNDGNFQYVTVNANIAGVNFTAAPGVGRWQIVLTGSGSYTMTWSGWLWDGPQPPFSIGNTEVRILTLYYDGTNYYATMSGVFA